MNEPLAAYAAAPRYEPIFVARQPVYNRMQEIWGYELLFRHSDHAETARVTDGEIATAKVVVDGFAIAGDGLARGKPLLVNFPQGLLLKGAPLALPPDRCVIEILETVRPTPDVVAVCQRYKEKGFMLALDDFVGQKGFEPLLKLADIIKIDVSALTPPEIIKLTQRLEGGGSALLAEKVESPQIYHLTRSLGFHYFQGYYFSRPEMMRGRKISMEDIARVRLLQELARDDYQIADLAKIINADVSLSYRLLKYVNSAALALRHKPGSISQALAILGSDILRQWLAAVILADLDRSSSAEEIVFISIRRARFLELLAPFLQTPPYRKEELYLLGLFSKLDALLGMTMQEILQNLPIKEELNAALCGEGNLPCRWLNLAATIDDGNWPQVGGLLAEFGLRAKVVATLHNQASAWAHNLLDYS